MFEGAGEHGIVSVPEPRRKLGIFLRSTAFYGGGRRVTARTEGWEFFQVPEPRRKPEIFLHPRAYM